MSLASCKCACVCLWPDAAEHADEVYNHSKRSVFGQSDVVEAIVFGKTRLFGTSRMLLPRQRPSSWPPWGCLAVAKKLEPPTARQGGFGSHRFARNLLVGTGGCRTAAKLQPSAMMERWRKRSRVRLCELATQCSLRSAMLARSQRLKQSSRSSAKV